MNGGNSIMAEAVRPSPLSNVRYVEDPLIIESDYPDYLLDESKMTGWAKYLFFPRSEEEIASVIDFLLSNEETLLISGARTGITGSAVPQGGGIVSTERMNRILGIDWDENEGRYYVQCQPAVTLIQLEEFLSNMNVEELALPEEYKRRLREGDHHYPVDPTERGASLGGTVATNASGARTFKYGPTREWVRRLRVMLPTGQVLDITRGRFFEERGKFIIFFPDGGKTEVPVPDYNTSPAKGVKNAAGIFSESGMDLIDLFIGSEGLLGIVTLVEVWLEELRPHFSAVLFFDDLNNALDMVDLLHTDDRIDPEFIELMDGRCLSLLQEVQGSTPEILAVPPLPSDAGAAIFFDLEYRSNMEFTLSVVSSMANRCGSSLERSWCGYERREMKRLTEFRHSAPERVNAIIADRKRELPTLHKLGTDISVPNSHLREMMSFYTKRLNDSGLEYVIFGHIGDNHPHVNILPRGLDDLRNGTELYLEFAKKAVSFGGSVSAEHGIGKLKGELLRVMYGDDGIGEMKKVKRSLDPKGILNPGNMFEMEVGE